VAVVLHTGVASTTAIFHQHALFMSCSYLKCAGKAELWRESCHQGAQGKLNSGDKVAIKVLSSESRKGTKEFLNEPNITHHNLLHGCCLDGGKRYQHLFSISEDLNSKEESSKQ
jgi:hypothetical protein